MLQVNIPEVRRGDRVILKNVVFASESRVTCLKGRNGSGKTTLLLALAGLIPHKGEIKPKITNTAAVRPPFYSP